MRILEEAFSLKEHEGRPGWYYRICVGAMVKGKERKLYCTRWVSHSEANGYWYDDTGQEKLRDIRQRLFDHIREQGELDDPQWKMRPKPNSRMVWTPDDGMADAARH